MPYGQSSFHSLSSVLYTNHALSLNEDPVFACQQEREDCTPDFVRARTACPARPHSNLRKMTSQLGLYLTDDVDIYPHGSLFTVKTKLKSSFVDDARPTDVNICMDTPLFAYVFSGKINSIYEIEQLDHVAH